MNNEKIILIFTFSLFFFLSAMLFYVMIDKDLKEELKTENRTYRGEPRQDTRQENIWPKVQIDIRK